MDAVELSLDKTAPTMTIAVSPSDADENAKASNVSVVNVASWVWSSTNNIANKIKEISDVSNLKVRLLRRGAVVTDWRPVTFYRLDRWMGSKEIAEVTAGPAAGVTTHN